MEMQEQWIPIIAEAVKWVKDKTKPSKKELQLKVSKLEEQVKILSYGNKSLSDSIEHIMSIVIAQLQLDGQYTISADTIIHVVGNSGQVNIVKEDKTNNTLYSGDKQCIETIFDNMDEEIIECKLMRPSEEVI